jgi:uncharacterized radical SAM superfamily protein
MARKKILKCYYPGKSFPAISITGTKCQLNCGHCGKHYLESMLPATDPETLLSLCEDLWKDGAAGVLISGGCDRTGKLDLDDFFGVFSKIKENTGLTLNLHTGLLGDEDIKRLAECGIDVVSFDMVGDRFVISEIYHLDNKPEDYIDSMVGLMKLNVNVVPHICIGLAGDSIAGELKALEMLAKTPPHRLIFIIFIPTKGTSMEHQKPPSVELVHEVITNARSFLPETELLLGCMRPRSPERYETTAIEAGVHGIVLPSNDLINKLKEDGWEIIKLQVCCAV